MYKMDKVILSEAEKDDSIRFIKKDEFEKLNKLISAFYFCMLKNYKLNIESDEQHVTLMIFVKNAVKVY